MAHIRQINEAKRSDTNTGEIQVEWTREERENIAVQRKTRAGVLGWSGS